MLDLEVVEKDSDYSLRTQISLSPKLRKAIDVRRRVYGESLSEFLRKSALLRLRAEALEREERQALAEAVVGSVSKSKSGWRSVSDVGKWQRKLRSAEDKHRK